MTQNVAYEDNPIVVADGCPPDAQGPSYYAGNPPTPLDAGWGLYGNYNYPYIGYSYGTNYPGSSPGSTVAASYTDNPATVTRTINGYTTTGGFDTPTLSVALHIPLSSYINRKVPLLYQGIVEAGAYTSISPVTALPVVSHPIRIYRGWVLPIPAAPILTATANCSDGKVTLTWADRVSTEWIGTIAYIDIWRNGVKIARPYNTHAYLDTTADLTNPVTYQVSYYFGDVAFDGTDIPVTSELGVAFWDGIGPLSNTQTVACGAPPNPEPEPVGCGCHWTQPAPLSAGWTRPAC